MSVVPVVRNPALNVVYRLMGIPKSILCDENVDSHQSYSTMVQETLKFLIEYMNSYIWEENHFLPSQLFIFSDIIPCVI